MRDSSKILLVGAGNMGAALLHGWLQAGTEPKRITVFDPTPSDPVKALSLQGLILLTELQMQIEPDVIVLAVKPQKLAEASELIARSVTGTPLLLSILAGITTSSLRKEFPRCRHIVRAMPSLPAMVGRGITACYTPPTSDCQTRSITEALLVATGAVLWLEDEAHMNAVTAVSGSGPAYVFYVVECLMEAGIAAGLPPQIARQLARGTVEGAGEMMFRDQQTSAGAFRLQVTSEGGTTEAALNVLSRANGLLDLMTEAVIAAKDRAKALQG
jgi:pyrroline-5-carboxylate reductase